MKKAVPFLTFLFCISMALQAQRQRPAMIAPAPKDPVKQEKSIIPPSAVIPAESAVTTKSTVTVKGQQVPYTATAGTLPVLNDDGKAIATVFYTFFERSDVKDRSERPLVISFNGGPGSA